MVLQQPLRCATGIWTVHLLTPFMLYGVHQQEGVCMHKHRLSESSKSIHVMPVRLVQPNVQQHENYAVKE